MAAWFCEPMHANTPETMLARRGSDGHSKEGIGGVPAEPKLGKLLYITLKVAPLERELKHRKYQLCFVDLLGRAMTSKL